MFWIWKRVLFVGLLVFLCQLTSCTYLLLCGVIFSLRLTVEVELMNFLATRCIFMTKKLAGILTVLALIWELKWILFHREILLWAGGRNQGFSCALIDDRWMEAQLEGDSTLIKIFSLGLSTFFGIGWLFFVSHSNGFLLSSWTHPCQTICHSFPSPPQFFAEHILCEHMDWLSRIDALCYLIDEAQVPYQDCMGLWFFLWCSHLLVLFEGYRCSTLEQVQWWLVIL